MSSTNANHQPWITTVLFPGHIAALTNVRIAFRVGAVASGRLHCFLDSRMMRRIAGANGVIVTLCVMVWYLAFTIAGLALHDGDPRWFVYIGTYYAEGNGQGSTGYDGQFAYYLARDTGSAWMHMDVPAYRYQRILYPLLVRAMSLGFVPAIPWLMLAVNLAAVALGTYLLARWCSASGLSAWLATVYGLNVGLFLSFSRDLNEPLAYAFVIAGLYLLQRKRLFLGAVGLLLAILARETTFLFPLASIAAYVVARKMRPALTVTLVSLLPAGAYQLLLWWRFGRLPLSAGPGMSPAPFGGLAGLSILSVDVLGTVISVILPAAICAWAVVVLLRRGNTSPFVLALATHVVLVVFLPRDVYAHIMGSGRIALGMPLAAVLCAPFGDRKWLLLSAPLWVLPTFVWSFAALHWSA